MVTIAYEAKNSDGHHCWLWPRTLMATIANWGQEPMMVTIAKWGQEP